MSQDRSDDKPKAEEGVKDDEIMESEGGRSDGVGFDPEKSNAVAVEEVEKAREDCEITAEELQELIKERKAERKRKAEKRRLEGLRRIAEMKSRSGIHPLEDLFPKEIWIEILMDKDLGPMDRYNMRQVHPVFQDLLRSTEIQDILFPLIMDTKIGFLESLLETPSRYHHPDVKEIIDLRCVSKRMRDSVDKFIEKEGLNHLRTFNRSPTVRFRSTPLQLFSTDQANMLRKISAFTSGPVAFRARRFFLRSLNVSIFANFAWGTSQGVQQNLQRFPEWFPNFMFIITKFLEEVGSQILHFELRFKILGMEDMNMVIEGLPMPQEVYGLIREWLLLMPNLKWLVLFIDPEFANNYVRNPPMPTLQALEGVYVPEDMSSTLGAVFVANPQIKYLPHPYWFKSYFRFPYDHPTILRLALEDVEWNFQSLQQTTRVTETNWNVLRMKLLIDDYDVSLKEVFLFLEQNFPTLEQLTLDISNSSNVTVTIGTELCFLRLANLRHFVFRFGRNVEFTGDFHFFFALHFLSQCGKLESIKWINEMLEARLLKIGVERFGLDRNRNKQQSDRLVEFQGEGGYLTMMDMRTSNIWDVFPRLRCITAKFRHYWYCIKERKGSVSVHCPEWDGVRSEDDILSEWD